MTTQYPNFKEVTKQDFFAFIGNRNVHPSPIGKWRDDIGYISEWKTPSGQILGITYGNGYTTYQIRK